MALPGEKGAVFPEEYLTKVPEKIQKRENRITESASANFDDLVLAQELLLKIRPTFLVHEDESFYFDYGAVMLGRNPQPDGPGEAKMICVGLGWLPGWEFTVTDRGLPDIVPTTTTSTTTSSSSLSRIKSSKTNRYPQTGVVGLLYKLVLDENDHGLLSRFSKKTTLDGGRDIPYAGPQDWNEAVPFHSTLKVMRRVKLYIHVFDGGVGHRCQKDGRVVPFRTPARPVHAVVHVDPPKPPVRGVKPQVVVAAAADGTLQGEWVAKKLNWWVKDAKLPQAYVDESLREWVSGGTKSEVKVYKKGRGGIRKFMGFK